MGDILRQIVHFINEQRATDFSLNHYVNAFIECYVLVLVQ